MRRNEYFKEQKRLYRYTQVLAYRIHQQQTCSKCNTIVEVLHHIDENHANNRPRNLLNLCRKHHLEIRHSNDYQDKFDRQYKNLPNLLQNRLKTAVHRHSRSKLQDRGVDSFHITKAKPLKIIDFITNFGSDKLRFSNYIITNDRGFKWHLITFSLKTLKTLKKMGFTHIYRDPLH